MNTVTFIVFCIAVIIAVVIRVVRQKKQSLNISEQRQAANPRLRKEGSSDLTQRTDQDELIENTNTIENKNDQLEFEIESDPLDGIDVNLYITHIVKLLVYSECGYKDTDNYNIEDGISLSDKDPLFEEAARLIVTHQQGSTSLIQRKFSIGYNRAGRLMDQLESVGIVGSTQGSKPREVLIMDEHSLEQKLNSIILLSFDDDIINIVEERFYGEILKRKTEFIHKIEVDLRIEKEQKLEEEKEVIREKLLEKERKKQLEREIRQDLIDNGLITPD